VTARIRRQPDDARRTAQDNAREFGDVVNGRALGWTLAALVAASVFTGKATDKINSKPLELGKITVREFAEAAGVSDETVRAYFSRWEKARKAGAPVPAAADLSPADIGTFPLPARPFNGPGGYTRTARSTTTTPTAPTADPDPAALVKTIMDDPNGPLATALANSAPVLQAILEQAASPTADPEAIQLAALEMSESSFETIRDVLAGASDQPPTPEPESDPAPTPRSRRRRTSAPDDLVEPLPSMDSTIATITGEISDEDRTARTRLNDERTADPLTSWLVKDEIFKSEPVLVNLRKMVDAVTGYDGTFTPEHAQFLTERRAAIAALLVDLDQAIESKTPSD
jgi:hypothetical protein